MAFEYKISRRLASEHKVMLLVSAAICLIGCSDAAATDVTLPVSCPAGQDCNFVSSNGSVRMFIPAAAIPEPGLDITALPATDPTATITLVTGTAWDVGPTGTIFNPRARLSIEYATASVQGLDGVLESELGLYKDNGQQWSIVDSTMLDPATSTVTAWIAGLSVYGILGAPVDSVVVSPSAAAVVVDGTLQLTAERRSASQVVLPNRPVTWASSDASVASVSSSGVVTGVALGTATITATSNGLSGSGLVTVGSDEQPSDGEPQPGASSVIVFEDDFESYTDCLSMATSNGGKWDAERGCGTGVLDAEANSGYTGTPNGVGGRSATFNWPVQSTESFVPLGGTIPTPGNGVSTYFSYYYRAPGFVYVGAAPRVAKKHFMINTGLPDGIELLIARLFEVPGGGKPVKFEWTAGQSSGPQIEDEQTSVGPWGPAPGTINHVTDGNWHRITIERKSETVDGAGDGGFRVWLDGVKIIDGTSGNHFPSGVPATTSLFMGSGRVRWFTLASTFNGGSPQAQSDYYDNVIVWYE